MKFTAITTSPGTSPPGTNPQTQSKADALVQADAIRAQRSYEKIRTEADRQFKELIKVTNPSIRAMSEFVKTVSSLTQHFKKLEHQFKESPASRPALASTVQFGRPSIFQGGMESVANVFNERSWKSKINSFFSGRREKEQTRLQKIGQDFSSRFGSLNKRWMQQDIAGVRDTTGLNNGKTMPMFKPPAGIEKVASRITQEFTQAIAESFNRQRPLTTLLTKLPFNLQQGMGKVTGEIAASLVTGSLIGSGRRTGRIAPSWYKSHNVQSTPALTPGFEDIDTGGTAPFPSMKGRRTRRIGMAGNTMPLKYAAGLIPPPSPLSFPIAKHPAGMLPPLPPGMMPPPPRKGGWLHQALAEGIGLGTGFLGLKKINSYMGQGADWDLNTWNNALSMSTNAPGMDFGGAGLSGLKSTTGRLGGPRTSMGTFGPTTPSELYRGLYGDSDLKQALTHTGMSAADWPKLFKLYGARTGFKGNIMSAAAASNDLDLGYKSFPSWVNWSGKLTQMGYGDKVAPMFEAMRGASAAGFGNNIAKTTVDETVNAAMENLSSKQYINNPEDMTRSIGGTMGVSKLPSIKMGIGVTQGLEAIQGNMGNVVNNPYLFTMLAKSYSQNNKGSTKGTLAGWRNTFGNLTGPNADLAKEMEKEHLPMEQQIAILGKNMLANPEDSLTALMNAMPKNMPKALKMQVLQNMMPGAENYIRSRVMEGVGSAAGPVISGADMSLFGGKGGVGDIDAMKGRATMAGYGAITSGENASRLANAMEIAAAAEVGLNKVIGKLVDGIDILVSKLPGTIPWHSVGTPSPSSGPISAHRPRTP